MAETIFNAVIAEKNSLTGSKQFQPSDGDSLLTWLLANIPSRGTLPFTFTKIGNASMSDLPSFANSTTEFEGTVFGYADRLVVELNRYSTAGYEKWVRTIYQNNWYGTWERVDSAKNFYTSGMKNLNSTTSTTFTITSGLSYVIIVGDGNGESVFAILAFHNSILAKVTNLGSFAISATVTNGTTLTITARAWCFIQAWSDKPIV